MKREGESVGMMKGELINDLDSRNDKAKYRGRQAKAYMKASQDEHAPFRRIGDVIWPTAVKKKNKSCEENGPEELSSFLFDICLDANTRTRERERVCVRERKRERRKHAHGYRHSHFGPCK